MRKYAQEGQIKQENHQSAQDNARMQRNAARIRKDKNAQERAMIATIQNGERSHAPNCKIEAREGTRTDKKASNLCKNGQEHKKFSGPWIQASKYYGGWFCQRITDL